MMGQSGTRRVSREALAPLSNEERAADGRSSKEVADFAGPWFLTLRALQLGSASRDLPLPGVNPDGQVTRGGCHGIAMFPRTELSGKRRVRLMPPGNPG
jgi:hypothetical protein